MANGTDWVSDVRRWVQARTLSTANETSNAVAIDERPLNDGLGELGYEAADPTVSGRYRLAEQTARGANKDPR